MSDGRFIHRDTLFLIEWRDPPGSDTVVMKYPTATVPSSSVLARIEREYVIGTSLDLPGIRKVVGRSHWRDRPALELEYIPGETFKTYFKDAQHRQIETVLLLAVSAAAALESLHGEGVVHRDINASNLLVREGGDEAVIIDLEFATQRGGDDDFVFAIEGQLPYLSPEQTGRIDLPVDERSDLYSFGIVLYEMLTGRLPFQAEDAAGWIHAHLARQPDPPTKYLAKLPRVVADIVMRLLSKVPDNRYQTARGLCRDLARCLDDQRAHGTVKPFTLGHDDHPGRLRFSSALYGREDEQRQLYNGLQSAIAGKPCIQFISGYAGAGKTALVNELRFPVAAAGGRFLSGKFDQTVRALPYAAFAEAVVQLCHQLLAGTPQALESFRIRVLESLGANAGLLLDFAPELEAVIGSQPSPPPLETAESANRFAITLLGFFHTIVAKEHPLVLFLDDLQWADAASLELLYMIVTRAVRNHFLIIAAYRDKELPPEHPLPALIHRLHREWPHINHIPLGGLSLEQTAALAADALDISPQQAIPLAAMVHAKTDGNPFFMRQVLETLVSEMALRFDPLTDTWHWETEWIMALDISDNVIELMLRKIARLPEKTRGLLQVAACIGNSFPLDLLAIGAEIGGEALQRILEPAVETGLIALLGGHGRFTHDRIQQAVYQSLTTPRAQQIHLLLGRHLLSHRLQYDIPLAATQQLNLGLPLIQDPVEKHRLAGLNLEAGDVARLTMAYVSAREFYTTGESLLVDAAMDDAETLFELRFRLAETIFCLGDVETAVVQLNELLASAPETAARTRIYQLLIDIYTVEIKLSEALETGNRALAELGVVIPRESSVELLQKGVDEVEAIVARIGEDVANWPQMHDEEQLAVAGLLTHLLPAAYIAASPQFPMLSVEFARRTLVGGLSRFSSFAISVFGMLLSVVLGRYESARRMGRLATEIAHRPDGGALRARAYFFHAAFIQHWSEPLEATLPFFDEGWKIGQETGDLQFTSYCINNSHGNALLAGQSLAELEQSLEKFEDINRLIRQEDGQHFFSMMKRIVGFLRKPGGEFADFMSDHDALAMLENWRQSGNASNRTVYHVLRCLLATILHKPCEALEEARQAATLLDGLMGMTWVPHHHFLHALALSEASREGCIETSDALAQIDVYCKQMEVWARHSPDNYCSKLLLIEAEKCELTGADFGLLLNAYDAAIDAALQTGRTYDHALSCELASACWLRRDKPKLAALYLQTALTSYRSWGAEAKVAQMTKDQASLLNTLHPYENDSSSRSSSSGDGLQTIEIYSVVKAAQAVAGELVMDRMLARLIELVIETAGAQSGFLLLKQNEQWCVVAARLPEQKNVDVLQWRSLNDYPEIAASVVQYVARTKEPVNLDDATKSTLFAADSTISSRHCKSLLCLPIVNRGELAGILYLENNLAPHAFTRAHTRVLQLLTTQAISSLEISRYYARVQNLNRSLQAEIVERKQTESKLEFLANHDALTELPNRRLFYDRIMHAIQRAQRNGHRVALLFLDLDQFKNINDTLSHQVGDELLQQVAERLAGQVRKGDTLGRLGGDEFVLLMEGDLDLRDLSMIAEKLLASFHEPFQVKGHDLYPTGCLGISLYPDDATDVDQLLRNADAAMYQAKRVGRNNFQFFSAKLAEIAAARLSLERELRRAIERDEFELYFQPQVVLETGKITGAEALLRWNHPSRGLLLPGDFIPVAEENGSIMAIGEWVLRQACRQLKQWRADGREIGSLAVNVSGSQIGPHSGFVELVNQVLEESDIDPASLELELTESVILQDTESTMRALENLNDLGLRIAIDDFGTGYSSLSYLHRLPAQRLKIDRSFVYGLPDQRDSAMIVQSILSLGNNLGKKIIAEGIEKAAQRDFLRQAGCIEGQGYLFGKPMPLSAFDELLSRD